MTDDFESDWMELVNEVNETLSQIEGDRTHVLADGSGWMGGLKNSPTFSRFSAEKLTALVMRLETYPVKTGDVVVRQKDSGDYFYIVKFGTFTVSQKTAPGEVVIVARLGEGDTFGEASLVSGERRNASIVADTDGELLRLSKKNFDDLVKSQLIKHVSMTEAEGLLAQGAVMLDVRRNTPDKKGGLEKARDLPVDVIREHMDELDAAVPYVIYCQNGCLSEAAAFLLSRKGLNVSVLKGGLAAIQ